MPQYMFLLRNDGKDPSQMKPEEFDQLFQRFVRWAEELQAQQRLVAVDRLAPSGGRTVRKRQDAVVVDGPYAEGKEAVLGYFIVEAEDEEHACRIAAGCPHVELGSVEVRAVDSFPKPRR